MVALGLTLGIMKLRSGLLIYLGAQRSIFD